MTDGLLLDVADLCVTYDAGGASVHALRGVTLQVHNGDAVGVVGESGSGKTTLALSTLRLLPGEAAIEGSVRLGGEELVGAPDEAVRRHRGRTAAYVIQVPGRGVQPGADDRVADRRAHAAAPGDEQGRRTA